MSCGVRTDMESMDVYVDGQRVETVVSLTISLYEIEACVIVCLSYAFIIVSAAKVLIVTSCATLISIRGNSLTMVARLTSMWQNTQPTSRHLVLDTRSKDFSMLL